MSPLRRVLVANRGEIAVRIFATLRRLGMGSVAVYTPVDRSALHVRAADEAIPLADDGSYLDPDAVVAAALTAGADAVHPGYGFLAENPRLARACLDAGLVFVGPTPEVIELMGDKIAARAAAALAGVPVLPGVSETGLSDAELVAAAGDVGFPLLVKPSAGGGGKGMRLVRGAGALAGELASSRREARSAFGDDGLLLERYLEPARHLEVQVLADAHGHAVHLGLRECSLQRRYQKVIEESPPALDLSDATAIRMTASAVQLARSCGYTGAGTVELILGADDADSFYFLEMNTRLQVEHPVTELVSGLDLVEWQLRVAGGEPLGFAQEDVQQHGHAIEARLYAEDPGRGFLPSAGQILSLRLPRGDGLRVDTGVDADSTVPTEYDPLLAKLVAFAPERGLALDRLRGALSRTALLGVATNRELLMQLLDDEDVRAGRFDTGLIERLAPLAIGLERADVTVAGDGGAVAGDGGAVAGDGGAVVADGGVVAGDDVTVAGDGGAVVGDEVIVAAVALAVVADGNPDAPGRRNAADPWVLADGWRVGEPAGRRLRLGVRGGADTYDADTYDKALEVIVRQLPGSSYEVRAGGVTTVVAASWRPTPGPATAGGLRVVLGGRTRRFDIALDGRRIWLADTGHTAVVEQVPRRVAGGGPAEGAARTIRSPMPGVLTTTAVASGAAVRAGELLAVVEAMKMHHDLVAPVDGVLTEWRASAGDRVELDEVLAVLAPGPPPGAGATERSEPHDRDG